MSYYLNSGGANIGCDWQRTFGAVQAAWLVTLNIRVSHCANVTDAYPQARAVVDDFGSLVIVRGWL